MGEGLILWPESKNQQSFKVTDVTLFVLFILTAVQESMTLTELEVSIKKKKRKSLKSKQEKKKRDRGKQRLRDQHHLQREGDES